MKQVLGCLRRADDRFSLIADGDHICVGLSGGKDSLALLAALARYGQFSHKSFTMTAITVDLGFPCDFTPLDAFCKSLGVPFVLVPTDIGHVVFEVRREQNPCALCAKMRRGALNEAAKSRGCNKVALGHNREDALETLMLSLFFESRLHTLPPVTYLSRTDLTVIRPLLTCPESELKAAARRFDMPVLTSPCPAAGRTQRQEVKELMTMMEAKQKGLHNRMLQALWNADEYGLWDAATVERMRHAAPLSEKH